MSVLTFFKYEGTGNDFIVADNRKGEYDQLGPAQIKRLCDRHRGIGADGLLLLQERAGFDFEMRYFNADGLAGSMCGNGARCMVRFAQRRGIDRTNFHFMAPDGPHRGRLLADQTVAIEMKDVSEYAKMSEGIVLDTGSPHLICYTSELESMDVRSAGRAIRYSETFATKGINVNFVQRTHDPFTIRIRTYERGVEQETLSCGTGATAAALMSAPPVEGPCTMQVITPGGSLTVSFTRSVYLFTDIWLCGPARGIFETTLDIHSLSV